MSSPNKKTGPSDFLNGQYSNNQYQHNPYKNQNEDLLNVQLPNKYIAQSYSPRAYDGFQAQNTGQKYAVSFKIFYDTIPGEDVCVVGSIPELGNWKDIKCHLTWTSGHIWVLEKPLIVSEPYFVYKYIMKDKTKPEDLGIWEAGIDRIADLRILPEIQRPSYVDIQGSLSNGPADQISLQEYANVKFYELNDEWEHFTFRFSVFYPIDDVNEELYLSIDKVGDKLIKMEKTPKEITWIYPKYGQNVRPYECILKIKNDISGKCGQFEETHIQQITSYQFVKKNRLNATHVVIEREPKRAFKIANPQLYGGQYGVRGHDQNTENEGVFFVNGTINKVDGGFLHGFFVSEIANTNLVIGPYPLYEIDVDKIKQTGVTAILNLQTSSEMQQRGVSPQIDLLYRSKKINTVINYPLDDSSEDSLVRGLLDCAVQLNQLVNERNQRVYIHCTSSITRSPTLAIVYLCLFVISEDWSQPQKVADFIKQYHKFSFPNMTAALRTIKENKHIQNKILREREEERLRLLRIAEEEAERKRQEAERQRKLRLEALENEKKRITKHHDDEEKRLLGLLKTLEDEEAERLRLLKLWEEQNLKFEHFADGEVDINGLSENEIIMKCDELFRSNPIPFIPQKGEHYKVQKEIERMINELDVTIPIIHVKGEVYLIGSSKQIIQYKQTNQLTVRVGGGFQKFDTYIPTNHKMIEKTLLMHMIKSKESLEWVCDALMNDKRIPQVSNPYELRNNEQYAGIIINRRLASSQSEIANRNNLYGSSNQNISPKSGRKSMSPVRQKSSANRARNSPKIAQIDLSSPNSPSKSRSPLRRQTLSSQRASNGFSDSKGQAPPDKVYLQKKDQLMRSLSQNQASKNENLNIINAKIQKELKIQEAERKAEQQLSPKKI